MSKFTTIKDEALKKKAINIIVNVAFKEEDQIEEYNKIGNNIEMINEFMEILTNSGKVRLNKDGLVESDSPLLKQQYTALVQQLNHQNKLYKITEEQLELQQDFIKELQSNYELLPNGYVQFNEEYFKDRINIYDVSGLTVDITKDDIEASKLRGSKVYEWAKELVK